MVKSEQRSLYSCDYIVGYLPEIDTKAITDMVLNNHAKKRVMHEDPNNIRGEDIRIDYDGNIINLKNKLCHEYKTATGRDIELCCDSNPKIHKDRNESYWQSIMVGERLLNYIVMRTVKTMLLARTSVPPSG